MMRVLVSIDLTSDPFMGIGVYVCDVFIIRRKLSKIEESERRISLSGF
jgi:hypothetical protein